MVGGKLYKHLLGPTPYGTSLIMVTSVDDSRNDLSVLTNASKCRFEVCTEPDDLDLSSFGGNATLNTTSSDSPTTRDRKDV
jgi:hypothetical protein